MDWLLTLLIALFSAVPGTHAGALFSFLVGRPVLCTVGGAFTGAGLGALLQICG